MSSRFTSNTYKPIIYKIGGTNSTNVNQPQIIKNTTASQPLKQSKTQVVKQQIKRYKYQTILKRQPQKIEHAINTTSIYYSPISNQVNEQKIKQIDNFKEINKPISVGYNEGLRNKTQVNSGNNDYLIEIYTKQTLRQILTGKFNPNNNPLKNVSVKLSDILAQSNTNYSTQRIKYESLVALEQNMKNDILSILKEKYSNQGRMFYQMTERTKLQNQSIDKIYDQVKRLMQNRQRIYSKESSQKNKITGNRQRQVEEVKYQFQKAKTDWGYQSKKRQQEYGVVVKENNNLKDQLKKINQQLSKGKESFQVKQNQLSLQVYNLSKQNSDLKRQLQSLSSRLTDVAILKDAKLRVEKELEEAKKEIKSINVQQSSFQTVHSLLIKDFQQIQKNYEAKEKMFRVAQAKNVELSNELNNIKQNLKAKVFLQTENQKLKKQVQKYRLQNERLVKSNIGSEVSRNQVKDLNEQLKRLQNQNEQNRKQIMQLQPIVNEKQEQIKIFQGQIQKAKRQISELRAKQQSNKLAQQLQKKILDSQKRYQSLRQEIVRKDKQLKQNSQIIKTKNLQISQLQKKQYQLTDQLLQARKEIETIEEKLFLLQKQRKTQANQSLIRMSSNDSSQKLLKQKDQQIKILKKNLQLKTKQFEQTVNRYQQAARQHSQSIKSIQQLKEQLNLHKKNANKVINDLQKEVKQLNAKIKSANQSKNMMPNSQKQNRYNMLYQHQLLDDLIQYKKFLTDTIEQRCRLRILKTKMIYHYDPLNRVNFHRYIDGINNLLLVLKTQGGTYTAAFTESAFSKEESTGDGLLISLNNKKYFTLIQQNKRAISYDDYYIIFGNSQLRIRSQQDKVFSNFGISNSYYASRGQRVTVLLGQRDREVDLEYYEIYQIIFDDY